MTPDAHAPRATACGKVILLGEHSVVYGRPALAAGLSPGVEARWVAGTDALGLEISPWNVRVVAGDASELGRALAALRDALPGDGALAGGVQTTVHLPGGGGLGSSAALGVAIARALGPVKAQRELTLDETLAAALAWEKIFHGNPSGVDHTVAALGGAGVFTRVEGFAPIALPERVELMVADSGERSRTRDMVASVARIHARRTEATERTFDAIASLVRNGALALRAGDGAGLGQLMDMNQALLSSLLLSTERIEALCRAAREAGAHGAKLTGSGGGGCVIALAPPARADAVAAAWATLEAPAWRATIG